jgi:hypothetical protein
VSLSDRLILFDCRTFEKEIVMSEKTRQKKAGGRRDKKNQALRQDVAARRAGATDARPKDKTGVPKAARAGRTKGKGGPGSSTHKDFSTAGLLQVERPARRQQAR